jgi:hypothetical protein
MWDSASYADKLSKLSCEELFDLEEKLESRWVQLGISPSGIDAEKLNLIQDELDRREQ